MTLEPLLRKPFRRPSNLLLKKQVLSTASSSGEDLARFEGHSDASVFDVSCGNFQIHRRGGFLRSFVSPLIHLTLGVFFLKQPKHTNPLEPSSTMFSWGMFFSFGFPSSIIDLAPPSFFPPSSLREVEPGPKFLCPKM